MSRKTIETAPHALVRLTGLPALVSPNTVLLVLGSFPGAASLAARQYYGHPQNHFWRILEELLAASPHGICKDSYQKRSEWMLAQGVGVWDVYASCERHGSLDANIRNPVVNDFANLRQCCPLLRAVAHNGGESFKHAKQVMAALGEPALPIYRLPSTSPANASWRLADKLAAWREVFADAGLPRSPQIAP
jgi:hypoxanthine-DNA glycosylase